MIGFIRDLLAWRCVARAYRKGRVNLPYPPLELWIEPTNRCNLRCGKCPHAAGLRREAGIMEIDLYRKVIDEIAGRTRLVSFHLGGESLLVNDLPDRIAYAVRRGLKTVLHTNALLLKGERVEGVIDSGLHRLSISVDGEDEVSYRDAMGGGDFNALKANVDRFLAARGKRRDPVVTLRVTRPSPDRFDRPGETPLARWGADFLQVVDPHVWSGTDAARRRGLGLGLGGPLSACARIWYGMGILWDGTAVPCCMDMEGEKPVGDVREERVEEVWNSAAMVELRRRHVEGRFDGIGICSGCDELRLPGPHGVVVEAKNRAKEKARRFAPRLFSRHGDVRGGGD